ncbi:MAG: hypothetical protein LC131_01025 [Anaerolineae bacterium]|nr:hypothetical protein [Anaerolineae bacterium]
MKTVIENAIKTLAEKAEKAALPHEAMNFAQAALNLAHTANTWVAIPEAAQQLSALLYAVERKYPGESRFDTALRYILSVEEQAKAGSTKPQQAND